MSAALYFTVERGRVIVYVSLCSRNTKVRRVYLIGYLGALGEAAHNELAVQFILDSSFHLVHPSLSVCVIQP